MKPGPYVEPRWQNISLYTWSRPGVQASLRQMTVEGTDNSWAKLEQAVLVYILNGIDMGSRCSYYMNFIIIRRKNAKQNWITEITMALINESQHEKTCLRGFRPCKP